MTQAVWMVLASLLFATMGVGVKLAAGSFNITVLVFYRGLVSVVVHRPAVAGTALAYMQVTALGRLAANLQYSGIVFASVYSVCCCLATKSR